MKRNSYCKPSRLFLKKFEDGFRLKREAVGFNANGVEKIRSLEDQPVVVGDFLPKEEVHQSDIAPGNDPAVSGADFRVGDIGNDDVGFPSRLKDRKNAVNGVFVVSGEDHCVRVVGFPQSSLEGPPHSKIGRI